MIHLVPGRIGASDCRYDSTKKLRVPKLLIHLKRGNLSFSGSAEALERTRLGFQEPIDILEFRLHQTRTTC